MQHKYLVTTLILCLLLASSFLIACDASTEQSAESEDEALIDAAEFEATTDSLDESEPPAKNDGDVSAENNSVESDSAADQTVMENSATEEPVSHSIPDSFESTTDPETTTKSTITSQTNDDSGEPKPGTREYLEWFAAMHGLDDPGGTFNSGSSTSGSPFGKFSPSGFSIIEPDEIITPEPGTREYLEWFNATHGLDETGGTSGSGSSSSGGSSSSFGTSSPSGFTAID
jgi:type II secretory pathway pseudopilin PulG